MIKRTRIGWTVLAGFIALCIWILNTESGFLKNINLGIDLQGGTELQYKLDLSSIKGAADSEVTEEIKNIISTRLDMPSGCRITCVIPCFIGSCSRRSSGISRRGA